MSSSNYGQPPGLSNTAFGTAARKGPAPLVELSPRPSTNIRIPVLIAATGVPQQPPHVQVGPGLTVTLCGYHGDTVNADDVFVATTYEEALTGGGRRIPPGGEVQFPVDGTGKIWYRGTQNDGLLITITGVVVG
jgi:hypothetical protein